MAHPLDSQIPALITGASSGIGAEFARQLAQRGHPLTLVARRKDRLEELAAELRSAHATEVSVLVADLETSDGRAAVADHLTRRPWLLVNNAGFGSHGRIDRLPADRELGEVELNVVALHQLMLAVLPGNVRARSGGVINVASTAAFQPLPYMSTYAATKAFVLSLSQATAAEMRPRGVRVMALCPGPVRTEFSAVADADGMFDRLPTMDAPRCVRWALRDFDRGRTISVPGVGNGVASVAGRLAPRSLLTAVVARALQPH
jgi:short-subunit dehydrogenase